MYYIISADADIAGFSLNEKSSSLNRRLVTKSKISAYAATLAGFSLNGKTAAIK